MSYEENPISKLISILRKLPGIGEKTATRLAYFILKSSDTYTKNLIDILIEIKKSTTFCSECLNISISNPCQICKNESRNKQQLCVVETPQDVTKIERIGKYNGVYHIIYGLISPLHGISQHDLKIRELIDRIKTKRFDEVILALNPTSEGEATVHYLKKILSQFNLNISRLSLGIPVGASLEFTDELTLEKAFEFRQKII